ncbi:MAG: penicillin-binding protein [Nitrospirae bacterium]|nr:penicillin-binding protein [Nitrospirota bacterium]
MLSRRKDKKRRLKIKIYLIMFLLIIGFTGVFMRLFNLHVVKNQALASRAEKQHQKTIILEGERGTILDRNGKILAANLDVPSMYASPVSVKDQAAASKKISLATGTEYNILKNKMKSGKKSGKNFVWLKRRIDPAKVEEVKGLGIEGIGLIMESQRFYPKGNLLSNVLGFAGLDNNGLEGLELRYDKYLRGDKRWQVLEKDALGKTIFPKDRKYTTPQRGKDIALTIDEVIQYISERELDLALERTSAKSGSIIVMDPRNGEILAMAVRPTFDPNHTDSYQPSDLRNRAITDPYEPGSTLKTLVASAAIEEGLVTPDELIYCENGSFNIGGRVLHDHEKHGLLPFKDVIKVSSNIGTAKVGMRLGEERLYKYIRAFGLGEKTDIDLSGESIGIVREPGSWTVKSLPSISIGQEVAATPIQLITAVAAIANGGWLMRPHLVDEIRDQEGNIVFKSAPEVIRRVVSFDTAREMIKILTRVTERGGTGEKAVISGYSVAGKTGTAQKKAAGSRGYSAEYFVSSFIGFVPSQDPRLIILVVIDEPEGVSWGGSIAAPVFKNVAEEILNYLAIPQENREGILMVSRENGQPGSINEIR